MIPVQVDKKSVLNFLGKTEKDIAETREEVKEWLKTQPHLPMMSDAYIEGMLRLSKYRVEKTKNRIDAYLSARNKLPEIYDTRKPASDADMLKSYDVCGVAVVDGYTDQYERVIIMKHYTRETRNYTFPGVVKIFVSVLELRMIHDFNSAEIVILDMENMAMSQIATCNLFLMKKITSILIEGYGFKLNQLHIVNGSTGLSFLLQLFKLIMKQKLLERIHVHKNYESLQKYVPKELLPEEYGGTQPPFRTIANHWVDTLKEQEEFFIKDNQMKTDESKRVAGRKSWFGLFERNSSSEELRTSDID